MDDDERLQVRKDFRRAVNMSPSELEAWLATEESKTVGDRSGGGESIGHRSGRRIVEIKRTLVADLDDDDHAHMRKVVGYIRRHLAQGPMADVETSRWRYSLMNWGHDPLRSSGRSDGETRAPRKAKKTRLQRRLR